jgi:hypothetical protein
VYRPHINHPIADEAGRVGQASYRSLELNFLLAGSFLDFYLFGINRAIGPLRPFDIDGCPNCYSAFVLLDFGGGRHMHSLSTDHPISDQAHGRQFLDGTCKLEIITASVIGSNESQSCKQAHDRRYSGSLRHAELH